MEEKKNDTFQRLKKQNEQLELILNAHIKVEEIIKNMPETDEFPERLVESLVDPQRFSAMLFERLMDKKTNRVAQTAAWLDENGERVIAKDERTGFNSCVKDSMKNKEDPFIRHVVKSSCPWYKVYGETTSYVSPLTYGAKTYGSICIRLDPSWYLDEKTRKIMEDFISKIAFSLYYLEAQETIDSIQRELEVNQKRFQMALEATHDGIWDWDLMTGKAFFSDRYYTMLGYDPDELEDSFETWKNLVHPADLEKAQKVINEHINERKDSYAVEFRLKTKDGKWKWILGRGRVMERDAGGKPVRMIGTHTDISRLKEQEKLLAEKNVELQRVNEDLKEYNEELNANNEEILSINKELETAYKDQENLNRQLNQALSLMGQVALAETSEAEFLDDAFNLSLNMIPKASSGDISLFLDGVLKIMTAEGHDAERINELSIPVAYLYIPEKATLYKHLQEKQQKKMPEELYKRFKRHIVPSKETIIAPINWGNEIIGNIVLEIEETSSEHFNKHDLDTLRNFSKMLSVFYSMRKYMEEEGRLQQGLILTLVKALEYYDEYTRGHSERVANWSRELARVTGASPEEQRSVYYASLMHDIGKIFVPQSVLNKISPLTDKEFELIQTHPVKSAELISQVQGMEEIVNIVMHHHEAFDGRGYPDGLKGEEIPYFSRVITVCDSYDAMTSKRPYRHPLTHEQARSELIKCKGTQFDPDLVNPFLEQVLEE